MFFYTANLTSPAFFPFELFPPRLSLSQSFYLKKGGRKCPPHPKLLACGFAFMQQLGFYAIACESVLLLYCKKLRHWYFCSVISQGRELLASGYTNYLLQEVTTMTTVFFMSYCDEQATMIQFLHCIVREQAMITWYYEGASKRTLYHEEANEDNIQPSRGRKVQLQGYGNDGPPCNYQICICCWSQWSRQWCVDCKKQWPWAYLYVVLQGKQWQWYFWCCKKCKQAIARCKDATIKLLYAVDRNDDGNCLPFYVILQGATTTKDGWLQQRRRCQATTNQTLRRIKEASNDCRTITLLAW